MRLMPLFDQDELYWALLARGTRTQNPEIVRKVGPDTLKRTSALPAQLLATLQALCVVDSWGWKTWPQVCDALVVALQASGLEVVEATAHAGP